MRDDTRQVEDETVKWAMSDVAPMSDEAFARGREALLARIDADESTPEESGKVVPLVPRRRRRIPLVAAAAAMVVIAGAALIAPSLVAREKGPSVGSAAAAVLNQAAGVVGDAHLLPGQYLYVLRYTHWLTKDHDYKWAFLAGRTLQTWIPADRRGTWLHNRIRTNSDQFLIGSEKDLPPDIKVPKAGEWWMEGEWRAEDGRWLGDQVPVSFTDPTTEYIAALPRDPRALYDKLQTEAHGTNLVLMVTGGLDTGMYPADVRSAIYQALTYLPGLEVVDRAAVLDSREGTALGLTTHGVTEQIVINPDTGDYLGSRSVQAEDTHGLKAGTVIGTTSITTRVVSGMGQPF